MGTQVEEKVANILPPVYGSVAAINCTTTPQVIDMTTVPLSKAMSGYGGQDNGNPINKFVRITAQGGDIYFTTGSNFALLNAIPNTSVFSTVNATTGAVTVAGGEMDYIPAGAWKDVRFFPANAQTTIGGNPIPGSGAAYGKTSPVRYVALASGAGGGVARLEQSSD